RDWHAGCREWNSDGAPKHMCPRGHVAAVGAEVAPARSRGVRPEPRAPNHATLACPVCGDRLARRSRRRHCVLLSPSFQPSTSMDHLNQLVFLWINATDPSSLDLLLGRLLANGLVLVFPLYVCASWLLADAAGRDALVQGVLTAATALLLSWLVGQTWFHPRPFMAGIGEQYLAHAPTASFPSNHLSFIWALCAGMG